MSYTKSDSIWEITTEGDCEGKTVKNLGIYQGDLVDIAFHLANKCYYSLRFKQVDFKKAGSATADSINISLDIGSGIWNMLPEQKQEFFNNLINNPEITVKAGYYGQCQLIKHSKQKVKSVKAQALAKLTEEEKEALGLKK